MSTATSPQARFHNLIGSDPLMLHLYEMIDMVSKTDVTVHIYGESGVGKELVAEAIHYFSQRREHRFVRLNCSAIPGTLLESALFGHVKGAFTDAHRDQQGYVEYAQGGTILLDEIGEVSHDGQVKVLRLLQSREYSRVGETMSRKANIRVITATNKDLTELMHLGKIREDFFYRINVFPLHVPPLRSRISDIELLTKHFIQKFNERFSKNLSGISAKVLEIFQRYSWPGNVRELENALEHAFVIAQSGVIQTEHIPEALTSTSHHHAHSIQQSIEKKVLVGRNAAHHFEPEEEKTLLLSALKQTHGHKSEAAKLLGISRVSLWKKIKNYGLRIG